MQAELKRDDLPVGEAYEVALALRERPVFVWRRPDEAVRIDPGAQMVLVVECFGRVGWCVGHSRPSIRLLQKARAVRRQRSSSSTPAPRDRTRRARSSVASLSCPSP